MLFGYANISFQKFQYFHTDLYRPLADSVQLHHLDLKPTKNIYQNDFNSEIIAEMYLILFEWMFFLIIIIG